VKLLVVMTAALTCTIITLLTGLFGPLEMPHYRVTPAPTARPAPAQAAPTPVPPTIAPPPATSSPNPQNAFASQAADSQMSVNDVPSVASTLAMVVPLAVAGMILATSLLNRAHQRNLEQMALVQERRLHALVRHLESERFVDERRLNRERFWRDQHLQARREQHPSELEQPVGRTSNAAPSQAKAASASTVQRVTRSATSAFNFRYPLQKGPLNGKYRGNKPGSNGARDPFELVGK
jgi:hypothetical protein